MPKEAVACAIEDLIEKGRAMEAVAVHLSFDGRFREQGWPQLRAEHCAQDRRGGFSLPLGDRRRGERVKTGPGQGVAIEMSSTKALLRAPPSRARF